MGFLEDFGFNPLLFVAQIINFVIIFIILKKLLYKPVLDMIKKREKEISDGIKNSELADEKLQEAEEKEKLIIQKANERARKIVDDAKTESEAVKIKSDEKTKKETERMIEQARRSIEQDIKNAEEKLTKKIGNIAISLLQKSLVGVFGEKEQKIIIKKAVSHLEKEKSL